MKMLIKLMNDNNLSFLTFTSDIDNCTISDFKNSNLFDVNFDIIGVEQTHHVGKQINVPCKLGYTGFFKMICRSISQWEIVFGGVCERKFILVLKNLEYIYYVAMLQIGNIFTQI